MTAGGAGDSKNMELLTSFFTTTSAKNDNLGSIRILTQNS